MVGCNQHHVVENKEIVSKVSFCEMDAGARSCGAKRGQCSRLCSKENFREPFGFPGVLAWVPRPKRWSPKLQFRGVLRAPKHFSWNFIKCFGQK